MDRNIRGIRRNLAQETDPGQREILGQLLNALVDNDEAAAPVMNDPQLAQLFNPVGNVAAALPPAPVAVPVAPQVAGNHGEGHRGMDRMNRGVPDFCGTNREDFRSWLERFDIAGTAEAWTDERKAQRLPTFLYGDAWDAFKELLPNEMDTYEHLKTNLRNKLVRPDVARANINSLFQRQQLSTECVQQYAVDLKRKVRAAFPDDGNLAQHDHYLLGAFLRGVNPAYREQVIATNPQNFNEAVQRAAAVESAKAFTRDVTLPPQTTAPIAQPDINSKMNSKMNAVLAALLSERLAPPRSNQEFAMVPARPEESMDNGLRAEVRAIADRMRSMQGEMAKMNKDKEQAYNRSHRTENHDWFNRPSYSNQGLVECYFCGKKGHMKRECYRNPDSPQYRPPQEQRSGNFGGRDRPRGTQTYQGQGGSRGRPTPSRGGPRRAGHQAYATVGYEACDSDQWESPETGNPELSHYSDLILSQMAELQGLSLNDTDERAHDAFCSLISGNMGDIQEEVTQTVTNLVKAVGATLTTPKAEPQSPTPPIAKNKKKRAPKRKLGPLIQSLESQLAVIRDSKKLQEEKIAQQAAQIITLEQDRRRYRTERDDAHRQGASAAENVCLLDKRVDLAENELSAATRENAIKIGQLSGTVVQQNAEIAALRDVMTAREKENREKLQKAQTEKAALIDVAKDGIQRKPNKTPSNNALLSLLGTENTTPDQPPEKRRRRRQRNQGLNGLGGIRTSLHIALVAALVFLGFPQTAALDIPSKSRLESFTGPMLCQTHEGKQIFSLPQNVPCHFKNVGTQRRERVTMTEIMIYKRNHIQYRSEAWACKMVQTSLSSLTYFFDNEHLRDTKKGQIPVSESQCAHMIRSKTCSYGQLISKGTLWQTTNEPDWTYSGGGTSCCYWKNSTATNCFMYKVFVYKRHEANEMQSTAGVVSHCKYREGKCDMEDGTFLSWVPDKREKCEYVQWKAVKGKKFGNNWISEDGNLALTFQNGGQTVRDCDGNELILSDQGIAFKIIREIRRVRRSLEYGRRGGIATTDLLAASLQAIEFDIRQNIEFSFQQALRATCRTMDTVVLLQKTGIIANPTLAMRAVLRRQDLIARAGGQAIEVWPCSFLKTDTYHFLPMNASFTNEIPIQFAVSGETHTGYLDPKTNIIHKSGFPADCSLSDEIPLRLGNKTHLYFRKMGHLEVASNLNELKLIEWNFTALAPLHPTIFHQIVMYEWKDLQSQITLNDLMQAVNQHEQLFDQLGVRNSKNAVMGARQLLKKVGSQSWLGFIMGWTIDIWRFWVFIICLIVSIKILLYFKSACCSNFRMQIPSVAYNLVTQRFSRGGRGGRDFDLPPSERLSVTPECQPLVDFSSVSCEQEQTPLQRVSEDSFKLGHSSTGTEQQTKEKSTPNTPHLSRLIRPKSMYRELTSPSNPIHAADSESEIDNGTDIESDSEEEDEESPKIQCIVEGSVGGLKTELLLDSCATLSLISFEIAKKLKGIKWERPREKAHSLSQQNLPLIASARVVLRIQGKGVKHRVHVMDKSPKPVVLGTDFLKKLGTVTFDFERHTVILKGGISIPMRPVAKDFWDVLVKESVVVPPRTEIIIQASIPEAPPHKSCEMLVEPDLLLDDRANIVVARSLHWADSNVPIRVVNPNDFQVELLAGQMVGRASKAQHGRSQRRLRSESNACERGEKTAQRSIGKHRFV
ncbi:MAG: hypothetical protein GY696_30470 [Gammaproteobacteria bacterium]|nr:hypothetical protein [Gammaproteobacteria bacterium]